LISNILFPYAHGQMPMGAAFAEQPACERCGA
jgi:hypothetical protein